jgi:hypothetical protein
MAETANQIRSDIEHARAKLGQDLNELEYRVKQETDWRYHVTRRPWSFVGGVFAVSMLLGMASLRRRRSS